MLHAEAAVVLVVLSTVLGLYKRRGVTRCGGVSTKSTVPPWWSKAETGNGGLHANASTRGRRCTRAAMSPR